MALRKLLEAFGDVEAIARAGRNLERVEGIRPELGQAVAAMLEDDRALARELAAAERSGARVVTRDDPEYPEDLARIPDPPPVLYVRGRFRLDGGEPAVAMVGTRQPSLYGVQTAKRLGRELAEHGVTVVSGLARGIDRAAHEGSLEGGGPTVAVLGCGLSHVYPRAHSRLAERVAESGALVSEYPVDMEARPYQFPRRNRIISGLSGGVVVVEAAHESGAIITADCALEQGRDVFAVPGPIGLPTSQGTNQLLKQGARLVTGMQDILEELDIAAAQPVRRPAAAEGLEADEAALLAHVRQAPRHVEDLAESSGWPVGRVWRALLGLELKRRVQQLPGQWYLLKP